MSAWRLWILLSAERGTLGREDRYGWATFREAVLYADTRLSPFDIRLQHEGGAKWNRVKGKWSPVERTDASLPKVTALPEARKFWWDRDE